MITLQQLKSPLILLLIGSLYLKLLSWKWNFRQTVSSTIFNNITPTSEQHFLEGPKVILEFPPPTPSPEEIITERMEKIAAVCAAKNNPNYKLHHMFYFPQLGITWLPVYKSSSTTWKQFLIDELLDPNVAHNGNHYSFELLNSFSLNSQAMITNRSSKGRKRVWRKEPNSSIRFTVIRHPLARLVSHYRNKAVGPGSNHLKSDIWVEPAIIFARQNSSWSPKMKGRYEIELKQMIHKTLTNPSPGNPYLSFLTFPELVRFILHGRNSPQPNYPYRAYMNDHWIPNAERTDICQNDLDIVVKLENEQTELPYLLERLNLTQHSDQLLRKANPSAGGSVVAVDEVVEHMKLLSKEEQRLLNEMYAIDYELFGYEPVYA